MERNFTTLIAGVCIFTFATLVNVTDLGNEPDIRVKQPSVPSSKRLVSDLQPAGSVVKVNRNSLKPERKKD